MLKKNVANQIAKLWNAEHAGYTPATKTVAMVEGDAVNIYPAEDNIGVSFYHTEQLADITRAFRADCIITIKQGKVVARIF